MTSTPDWVTCQWREGCSAIQAKGFDLCLAHLDHQQLDLFRQTLQPGGDLDARGTTITAELLDRLLEPLGNIGRLNLAGAELDIARLGPLTANSLILDGARFRRWA